MPNLWQSLQSLSVHPDMATRLHVQAFDFHDDLPAYDFLGPAMEIMADAFDPAYGEAWSHAQTISMLTVPLCHTQLATAKNGEAAAFTMSRAVADEEELLLIAVTPDHRGLGLGKTLLARLVTQSKARGCSQLFLEVRQNNAARYLYEKMNFIQIGVRKDYYTGHEGKRYDALTYACKIM